MAEHFQAYLNWYSSQPLYVGRLFKVVLSDKTITASVTQLKYCEDSGAEQRSHSKALRAGQRGCVNINFNEDIHLVNGDNFAVYDLDASSLVADGSIIFPLFRSETIRWQSLSIDKRARAILKQQKPCCIWFTGLSGSGKSTIANLLEQRLYEAGCHTYLLDGDNVRHGLSRDLGFTEADRVENIRRVAEVARLMVDAGLIVLASFISPFQAERKMARGLFSRGEFLEIFVDTPLSECERRDVKGLYAKARRGELKNFTGIDSAYEKPEQAEFVLDTCQEAAEDSAYKLFLYLQRQQYLQG